MQLMSWKSGWKTYAVCIVGIALGVAEHYHVQIPWWVDLALPFLGLGALRHAVETRSAAATLAASNAVDAFRTLGELVLNNVTKPAPVEADKGGAIDHLDAAERANLAAVSR